MIPKGAHAAGRSHGGCVCPSGRSGDVVVGEATTAQFVIDRGSTSFSQLVEGGDFALPGQGTVCGGLVDSLSRIGDIARAALVLNRSWK